MGEPVEHTLEPGASVFSPSEIRVVNTSPPFFDTYQLALSWS